MNKAMRLLEAIGYIQDEYILEAHRDNIECVHANKKIMLIAAIAAILLLLAGCAAFAYHWYTVYFTQVRQAPLSDSQIEYIDENAQEFQLSQTHNGYTVELISAISESRSAYVTFGLTAPDDVDLSSVLDPNSEERLSFQGLFATVTGNGFPADISCDAADDGDGKKNTLNIVLRINPAMSQGEAGAFGPGTICTVEFNGIVQWNYDPKYEQELLAKKYAGQTDYILDPEESNRVHPQTLLAAGDWKFEIELTSADAEVAELLNEPILAKVLVVRIGNSEYETEESVEEVTLTSIQLSPLGATISFEKPEPIEKFDCIYINVNQFGNDSSKEVGEEKGVSLVMRDGTKIYLYQEDGAKEEAFLNADSPIALKEADYLLLSDGTKLDVLSPQQ